MMGSRSIVEFQDVSIVDEKGLNEFLELLKSGEFEEYKKFPEGKIENLVESVKFYGKNGIEFDWDGWKIIGYWYELFVQFVRDVAVFIDGTVELFCPDFAEKAIIVFNGGTVLVRKLEWRVTEENKLEDFCDLTVMPDFVKERLLIRTL